MPLLTPRLGLIMPQDPETQEIDQINANSTKLDKYIGLYECTSATRPSGAAIFVGLQIYETDTKQIRTYVGGSAGLDGWVWAGGVRPYGQLTKNDGFQAITGTSAGTPTQVKLVGGANDGGMSIDTADAATSRIKLPEDGLYQIDLQGYHSGGSIGGALGWILRLDKPDGTFQSYWEYFRTEKVSAGDVTGFRTSAIRLVKGNMLRVAAFRYGATPDPSAWGGSGKWESTALAVTYVGPLA